MIIQTTSKQNEIKCKVTQRYSALHVRIGIQPEVLAEVTSNFGLTSDTTEDWQRYIVVSFDEMKINKNIVYNSNSGTCEIGMYTSM